MCPMCDCGEAAWMGRLGPLVHICCRACGWVYSCTPEEVGDECDAVG